MILYLLVPALVPALVLGEAEMGNATAEGRGQTRTNLTFSLSISNRSSSDSGVSEEERSRVEEELQGNWTAGVVTEDQESFQDEEDLFPGQHCLQDELLPLCHVLCGNDFHAEMSALSADDWCVMENIIRPYNVLTVCVEKLSHLVGCFFPNSNTQDFFLHIHSLYFQRCRQEEQLPEDAPHGVVVALTLVPVCLIPFLVYMVIWKSKAAT